VSRANRFVAGRLRAHFSSTGGTLRLDVESLRDAAAAFGGGAARQNGPMKTIQLRRYTLVDGTYDAFVEWWHGAMPAVRPPAGFTIEFAYGLRESNEFVWAVSAPGDRSAFLDLEQAYLSSDARAAVFEGVPQRVAAYDIRFVDDIAA
jgi:hypothetical protein